MAGAGGAGAGYGTRRGAVGRAAHRGAGPASARNGTGHGGRAGAAGPSAPVGAGELLLRWIGTHEARFDRDTPVLLAAATCPLPEVRAWGLARVRRVGMDLPFALRLLESGLPEPEEAGRAFFAAPAADE